MDNIKKSRTWMLILISNLVIAFATGWTIFSYIAVVLNALYLLVLVIIQLKGRV